MQVWCEEGFAADLIVLGGCAAVEEAAKKAGHDVKVLFSPGARTRRRSRPIPLVRCTRADRRRFPQLPAAGARAIRGRVAGGQGKPADADCSRDDCFDRWPSRAECKLRTVFKRCLHQAARSAEQ